VRGAVDRSDGAVRDVRQIQSHGRTLLHLLRQSAAVSDISELEASAKFEFSFAGASDSDGWESMP
jgi:hypothetical protein